MFTWVLLQKPQEQSYLVLTVYAVFQCYIGTATAIARAALPSPTNVYDVLMFTRRQQPQEQLYPVLPTYNYDF